MQRSLFAKFCLAALLACSAHAQDTFVWTGGGADEEWTTSGNWEMNGAPAVTPPTAGSTVTIPDGSSVVLTAMTEPLGSIDLQEGALLTVEGWDSALDAAEMMISGTITHAAQTATEPDGEGNWVPDNRILLTGSNITISETGVLDADEKGFGSDAGEGTGSHSSSWGGGGGYGGRGGMGGRYNAYGGNEYGSVHAPEDPGSGGRRGNNPDQGGPGGGAVRINATGKVMVEGTITANGALGGGFGAGGSGGAIYITCATFGGGAAGVLRANGGNRTGSNGAGGGGRIAVAYSDLSGQPGVRFSTSPGSNDTITSIYWYWIAGWGTLSLSDTGLFSEEMTDTRFTDVRVYIDGLLSWTVDNLLIENNSFELAMDGFQLTVNNDLTLGINSVFGIGVKSGLEAPALTCGGHFRLTNNAELNIYAGVTNETREYGALINAVDMTLDDASVVHPYSHSENGGSVMFDVKSIVISDDAEIDASGRGYAYGKGRGAGGSGTRAGGGGYGGRGGDGLNGLGGDPYGSLHEPVDPGSGSGVYYLGGAYGGGLVRIHASEYMTVDGNIRANGLNQYGTWRSGGGAGGSIYLTGKALEGEGHLEANGGSGEDSYSGGGGGGRIAIVVMSDRLTRVRKGEYIEYAGSERISVDGGTGNEDGTAGTFLKDVPIGTVFTFY